MALQLAPQAPGREFPLPPSAGVPLVDIGTVVVNGTATESEVGTACSFFPFDLMTSSTYRLTSRSGLLSAVRPPAASVRTFMHACVPSPLSLFLSHRPPPLRQTTSFPVIPPSPLSYICLLSFLYLSSPWLPSASRDLFRLRSRSSRSVDSRRRMDSRSWSRMSTSNPLDACD